MWFDVQAALAEVQGGGWAGADMCTLKPAPRVAVVAKVATRLPQKLEIMPSASDPETYIAHLSANGPQTCGAVAVALGWGATRAWQAEVRLRAAGLVQYDVHGKAFANVKGESA